MTSDHMHHALQLTGERTLPGIAEENYWFRRHEAGYLAVAPFCRGAVLVEVGAGEGYGANLLAAVTVRTVTVDYDDAAARHASHAYPRLAVLRGNAVHLPLADESVEVVACLQVIEHLWDQPGFVAECARVLAPAGTLLLSTPNRLTFPPGNHFHSMELSAQELRVLVEPRFDVARMYGLRHGRRLRRMDRRHGGSMVNAQLASPPAAWRPRLRQDVAAVRTGDFTLSTAEDDALDLIAVAIRRPALMSDSPACTSR